MNAMGRKRCETCDFCKRLFSGAGIGYYREKELLCTEKQERTQKENSCGNWKAKQRKRYDFSASRFEKAEKDIVKIAELLAMLSNA